MSTGHDISTKAGLAAYRAALAATLAEPKPREVASLSVRAGRLTLALALKSA